MLVVDNRKFGLNWCHGHEKGDQHRYTSTRLKFDGNDFIFFFIRTIIKKKIQIAALCLVTTPYQNFGCQKSKLNKLTRQKS